VIHEYWHRPEETKASFYPDGFLKTGDMAVVDADGFVFLKERKKDMIIISGFNVYPTEIEDVLAHHPGILEVAVIGVPSAETGEAVKAFIVKRNPLLTTEEVIQYCRTQLTAYKIPKQIEFCTSLPKSNVGKILRRALRPGV
jgi:long-chain acyl-CoA synthetase